MRTSNVLASLTSAAVLLCAWPAAAGGGTTCAGDCNGDGNVSVDELVIGVNIALGNAALENCPSFDSNADGSVTVDEVIAAMTHALIGCPMAPTPSATPILFTPTRTATPSRTPCLLELSVEPVTSPWARRVQIIRGNVNAASAEVRVAASCFERVMVSGEGSSSFAIPTAILFDRAIQVCANVGACEVCTETDRDGDLLIISMPSPTPTFDTPLPTSTPTASATPTPTPPASLPTATSTISPTRTPVDCGAVVPSLDPVTSPTQEARQLLTGTVFAPGPRLSIQICGESGCFSQPVGASHPRCHAFGLEVDLIPDSVNHLRVCAVDNLCGISACIPGTVDITHQGAP